MTPTVIYDTLLSKGGGNVEMAGSLLALIDWLETPGT